MSYLVRRRDAVYPYLPPFAGIQDMPMSSFAKPTDRDVTRSQLGRIANALLRLAARKATLYFDGTALTWIENGLVRHRWPVACRPSGASRDNGYPAPIPAGRYVARQVQPVHWRSLTLAQRVQCLMGEGPLALCARAWASRRILLEPWDGAHADRRPTLSIHGHAQTDTPRCIDLGVAMQRFATAFLRYAKDMDLVVLY